MTYMKTIIYARVSTSHHQQKPEVQINELNRFCKSRGWDIAEEIIDHGYSCSTENRPGLKRLLYLVESNQVEAVVVLKLDRLFRSLKHLVTTLENFERAGIKFVAVQDNVDYSTPSGRFFVQILGSLGEFERSLLRERTMSGLDHARSKGKIFGRPRIHDQEAILSLYRAGETYRQIQKKLGAPMGSISRAIKTARKSLNPSVQTGRKNTALNTTVLCAETIPAKSEEMSDKKDNMSDSTDLAGSHRTVCQV